MSVVCGLLYNADVVCCRSLVCQAGRGVFFLGAFGFRFFRLFALVRSAFRGIGFLVSGFTAFSRVLLS